METALKQNVRVFPNPDKLAEAAAGFFAGAASRAIAARGRFSVAVPGGSTPRLLFRILGSAYRESIRWKQVHIFWSDERSVPPDHEQSNYRLAYEELISKIPMPSANIHRIRGELDPAEAAREYEEELHRHFGDPGIPVFDLILLGVGQDGHTASLFPDEETLKEDVRLVIPSYSEADGNWRVTLTLPVLNNAFDILLLVSGKSKAGIISEILEQGRRDNYPAGLVRPSRGSIIWFLDREAASGLKAAEQ